MASESKELSGKPSKIECKLAGILESNLGLRRDCTPEHPMLLRANDVKLHYILHYIDAGEWDYVIPKEGKDFSRIYGYRCNLCSKRFSNSFRTKSFAGRRSVLSHLGDSHGLLLRSMKLEQRIDLAKDIEEIIAFDEGFKKMMTEKANIDQLEPKDWITIMEFPEPLQLRRGNRKVSSNGKDVGTDESHDGQDPSEKRIETNKEVHQKPDLTDDIPSPELIDDSPEKSIIEPEMEPIKKPPIIECPHCDEFKGNHSGSLLRLHIYTHYLQHWEHEMEQVKENSMICQLCNKKITGQNLEGTRRAVACHYAVRHFQLRSILENDTGLPQNFVSDLYRDFDEHLKLHNDFFTSFGKSNSSQKRRYPKKKDSYQSSGDSDILVQAKTKPKKKKSQSSTPSVVLPGDANPNYVRKRTKINFSLDDDESNESDNSWDDTKIVAKIPPSSSKSRIMPKRSATKVWSFLDDSDDGL